MTPDEQSNLLEAMVLFETFSRIVLQRAVHPNGTVGYLCSVPLELNDERRKGQRMETLDAGRAIQFSGDGRSVTKALLAIQSEWPSPENFIFLP